MRPSLKWPVSLIPLLDGSSNFQNPVGPLLVCLFGIEKNLYPEYLVEKILIFYRTQAWPKYPLGDQE
jgi:hypothetical protein